MYIMVLFTLFRDSISGDQLYFNNMAIYGRLFTAIHIGHTVSHFFPNFFHHNIEDPTLIPSLEQKTK